MTAVVNAIHHANLLLVLVQATTAVKFAEVVGWPYAMVVAAKGGRRALTPNQVRELEELLQVDRGWMAVSRTELPGAVQQRVAELTAQPKSDEAVVLDNLRRQNLNFLVPDVRGAKTAFARQLGWAQGRAQNLFARGFSSSKARELEELLGLQDGWFEQIHSLTVLPELSDDFDERLNVLRTVPGLAAPTRHITKLGAKGLSLLPASALDAIASPIVRALVQKTASLAIANRISERQALTMLTSLMELESAGDSRPT